MYLDKKSGEKFYHPVSLCWEVLALLGSFEQNHDQMYLDSAIRHANKLADVGEYHEGALWFPYRFDYAMNHDPAMALPNPWYSGMAQGMALSVFSWLHEITGENSWRKLADAAFKSFDHSVSEVSTESPWFVYSPDSETVWFEEYPGTGEPSHVINGHIYAAFGLIDYYRITHNVEAAKLFSSAAQTVSRAFNDYRFENGASYYCAAEYCKDQDMRPGTYHTGVIHQLGVLARTTGKWEFSLQADQLRADQP
ncbi:D-glucuronyl C5-epimerase C-terminus [Bowdeniella nasicola]|uniref:D-glucuronyl C5-epimerase C-terminus n=1 Tax=Bowdeniella nasicola TaxID=208480 RepID=A0A1H3VJU0_9ACTO|nr:D-glucuronyl C5-epimerase family protein [Bowdeniella nasicola]SDZ75055.1 D-glucuronyl C5-epimerase C-terminus [Bowdeniella nasicola]